MERVSPRHVTLVSKPGTLDALQRYLASAGFVVHGTTLIERAADMTSPSYAAVILFPDDYVEQAVTRALADLRESLPEMLTVVVTKLARRFAPLAARQPSLLIVPKPAWGFAIVEAVHRGLEKGNRLDAT